LRPGDKIDYSKRKREEKEKADKLTHASVDRFVNEAWGDRLTNDPIPKIKETIEKERRLKDNAEGKTSPIIVSSS